MHEYVACTRTTSSRRSWRASATTSSGSPRMRRSRGSGRCSPTICLLQLPDEDWVALRDVYEVDGDGGGRSRRSTQRHCSPDRGSSWASARWRMAKESATLQPGRPVLSHGEPADVCAARAAAGEPQANRVRQGRRGARRRHREPGSSPFAKRRAPPSAQRQTAPTFRRTAASGSSRTPESSSDRR